ncbi:SH3 domain-binding protein 2-like [Physella acuta]|uniref:SH3 domain-binding protein 2-like n=1 Tax=Physella acuta TaxID=109671 RepID=UPI0027DD00A0|nr:SH3 domain-binding protein 2-like [Physella acuta]XP_059141034.1 SH3 domain-binding protein 2-like [Physella acuta]
MTSAPSNVRVSDGGLSAQDLIKMKAAIKYGLLRKKNSKLTIGKWPYRFIVLVKEAVYVFHDENSKTASNRFSLTGYNRVKREDSKSHDWCFVIVPAQKKQSVKSQFFACVSDQERKDWMRAIKNQIYASNNVQIPELGGLLSSLGNEEEYNDLESIVFPPEDKNIDNDTDSDFSDSSDEFEEPVAPVYKTKRSQSLPHVPSDFAAKLKALSSGTSTYEDITPLPVCKEEDELKTKPKRKFTRSPSDPQPKPPPRYSEVVNVIPEPDYANLKQIQETYQTLDECKPSLEAMCTVDDPNPDRDHLICLLQAKQVYGTYLIRKSRQSDDKVLSYLTRNLHVKEYKIYSSGNEYSLDKLNYFATIDALLDHYTKNEHLPNSDNFLNKGYNQVH